MTEPSAKPRKVRCPTCGADVVWSAESPYRPFCSERCRLIDLGRWLDESQAIPLPARRGAGLGDDEPDEGDRAAVVPEEPPDE